MCLVIAGVMITFATAREKGYVIRLTSNFLAGGTPAHTFLSFLESWEEYEIPANSFLEYRVFIPPDSAGFTGGVDLIGGSLGSLRDRGTGMGVRDQYGNSPHPGGSAQKAKGRWWHRKFDLDPITGKTFTHGLIVVDAGEGGPHTKGTYRAYYKNIQITDGRGKVLIDLFTNKKELPKEHPERIVHVYSLLRMTDYSLEVIPLDEVK